MTIRMTVPPRSTEDSRRVASLEATLAASVCANCDHRADCASLRAAVDPIQYCDLHESAREDRDVALVDHLRRQPVAQAAVNNLHCLGLCATCEARTSCQLPKSPAGVWHCEEYR